VGEYRSTVEFPDLARLVKENQFDTIYHEQFSSEQVTESKCLILPWNLKTEIVAQLSYAHEWGAKFIVSIPTGRILD
jgi:hypothetical protein